MSRMRACHIFGAGEMHGAPAIGAGDLVIAADAGYLHAQSLGVPVDVVVGDFDSMDAPVGHPCVITLNPIKDETDMFFAIRYALDRGHTLFHLYGGTGGRLSHTLANIGCLAMLAKCGARGYLYGDGEIMTAVANGAIRFGAASRGVVSAFALSGACSGVCETGLKYALDDYTLRVDDPIGVSNEFTGRESEISVRDGTLLIAYDVRACVQSRTEDAP